MPIGADKHGTFRCNNHTIRICTSNQPRNSSAYKVDFFRQYLWLSIPVKTSLMTLQQPILSMPLLGLHRLHMPFSIPPMRHLGWQYTSLQFLASDDLAQFSLASETAFTQCWNRFADGNNVGFRSPESLAKAAAFFFFLCTDRFFLPMRPECHAPFQRRYELFQ